KCAVAFDLGIRKSQGSWILSSDLTVPNHSRTLSRSPLIPRNFQESIQLCGWLQALASENEVARKAAEIPRRTKWTESVRGRFRAVSNLVHGDNGHSPRPKAAVRAAVRRVLRRRGVREEDFDPFLERIMQQAEAIYADWPQAA